MTKKIPQFWWDLNGGDVIVESDDADYPLVAVFPCRGNRADKQIERADALIADLEAGRQNHRKLARTLPKSAVLKAYGTRRSWRGWKNYA